MKEKFRIAARAVIVKDQRLLFVSDEGEYWYLPGGRLECDESLQECAEREAYEETGLRIKAGKLLYILESFDIRDQIHAIHFFFQTTVLEGDISHAWSDAGGTVQFRQYFSLTEIEKNPKIVPRFLAVTDWHAEMPVSPVYRGCVTVRGLQVIEDKKPELESYKFGELI